MREIKNIREWLKFTPSDENDDNFKAIIDKAKDDQILVYNALFYAMSEEVNKKFIKLIKNMKKHF